MRAFYPKSFEWTQLLRIHNPASQPSHCTSYILEKHYGDERHCTKQRAGKREMRLKLRTRELCVLKDLKNAQLTSKLFLFVHCHYLMMCSMHFDDVRWLLSGQSYSLWHRAAAWLSWWSWRWSVLEICQWSPAALLTLPLRLPMLSAPARLAADGFESCGCCNCRYISDIHSSPSACMARARESLHGEIKLQLISQQ